MAKQKRRKVFGVDFQDFDDVVRAIGVLLIALGILAAAVYLVVVAADTEVAMVVVGGLVVSLKDVVAYFTRNGRS